MATIWHPFGNYLTSTWQPFANNLPTSFQPYATYLPTIFQQRFQPYAPTFPTFSNYMPPIGPCFNRFRPYATHCQLFANHLPPFCQLFYLPIICQLLYIFANHLSIICQPFATYLPTIFNNFSNICSKFVNKLTTFIHYHCIPTHWNMGSANVQNQLALICNNVEVICSPFGNFFILILWSLLKQTCSEIRNTLVQTKNLIYRKVKSQKYLGAKLMVENKNIIFWWKICWPKICQILLNWRV